MTEQDRVCGALGCTNKAVGTVPHNGKVVWTCKQCAERHGKEVVIE